MRVCRLPIELVLVAHRGSSVCPLSLFCLPTESGHSTGSAAGATATTADKTWNVLNGLGSMAFAYSFSFVLVEIQVSVHFHTSLVLVEIQVSVYLSSLWRIRL